MTPTMTKAERAAYQRGFFLGRGYTQQQVDDFEALMSTLPSVRPAGPRIGCATDTTRRTGEVTP